MHFFGAYRILVATLMGILLMGWFTARTHYQHQVDQLIRQVDCRLAGVADGFSASLIFTALDLKHLRRRLLELDWQAGDRFQQAVDSHFEELLFGQELLSRYAGYTRIALLDRHGNESVAARRAGNRTVKDAGGGLRGNVDQPLFTQATRLAAEQVFFSGIEPGVEHGDLVRPPQPLVRIALSLFDSGKALLGWLSVNLDISGLLELLHSELQSGASRLRLSSPGGIWELNLANPNPGYLTFGQGLDAYDADLYQSGRSGRFHDGEQIWLWTLIDPLQQQSAVFSGLDGASVPIRLQVLLDPELLASYHAASYAKWLPICLGLGALVALLFWKLAGFQGSGRQTGSPPEIPQLSGDGERGTSRADREAGQLVEVNINGILT